MPDGDGFIESLGYEEVRNKPNPSWQNSIRKVSDEAFNKILNLAGINTDTGVDTGILESESNVLDVLRLLNKR